MHELRRVIKEIEHTHKRLGNLVAFGLLCVKAKKCLLIVAPAGTGKSRSSQAIALASPNKMIFDSITRSALAVMQDEMSNYDGLVVIDDMGKIDTAYSRMATLTTFAELCYSHFVSKHTVSTHIEITNFNGSAVLNTQPPILGQTIAAMEWEAVLMDKTIRYYHLYRPTKPVSAPPDYKIESDISISDVELTGLGGKLYDKLWEIAIVQWSDARAMEHLHDLLKAAAAWDGRMVVNQSDYALLSTLMPPLSIERHLIVKYGLETDRVIDLNLLAMLVELASWKQLTVKRVCRDYKVSAETVLRVLRSLPDYFSVGEHDPEQIQVSPKIREILKQAGVK